ncbi:MAG: F0F1 ATP synthase subunit delta [Sulfurospirillum sp.]|nr:F0F1 ATP synthase subunit delta [Sulfurospirillum sp.]
MKAMIAKKYVNALIKSCTQDELQQTATSIASLSTAFALPKLNNIIFSQDLSAYKKEKFILSLVSDANIKTVNFLKLLAKNDRFALLPAIDKELKFQIACKQNSYQGTIVSNFTLNQDQVAKLEERFSKKFAATIALKSVTSDYPGIKIELDDLGVEMSFSFERLKAQMVEHILKAI